MINRYYYIKPDHVQGKLSLVPRSMGTRLTDIFWFSDPLGRRLLTAGLDSMYDDLPWSLFSFPEDRMWVVDGRVNPPSPTFPSVSNLHAAFA